jgi:hypothetical protein
LNFSLPVAIFPNALAFSSLSIAARPIWMVIEINIYFFWDLQLRLNHFRS